MKRHLMLSFLCIIACKENKEEMSDKQVLKTEHVDYVRVYPTYHNNRPCTSKDPIVCELERERP